MPRYFSLWLGFYYCASALAICALVLGLGYINWDLIKPIDVGGTLFGGGMAAAAQLMGWAIVFTSLMLCLLLRLPGATLGSLVSGALLLGISAGWRLFYPDDFDGNLLYSPTPREIDLMLMIGAALFYGSWVLWRRRRAMPRVKPVPGLMLALRTLVAACIAGCALFMTLKLLQPPLPTCAFNKAGQQLSICLGDGLNERVIVD
ncbi:hypothetical protein M1B34_31350 [Pseudomonas sp. MAFF 302030]|jgi:hypothetical protein|uniref:Uncharacterized protein n=1 Tax=Pseudomonas morbosilactucae TaxID=2938197 RepID=A0A9X1Z1H0_9PSED|nr:hypothetical protein [Pseudomonas morbosilactucae]MCK9802035.1 hypothetical protein [Pseudomonas morbosilactucae]